MKREDLLEKVNKLNWFQKIELPTDEGDYITTPGIVDYCNEETATSRFGLPEYLTDKRVIDVGCNGGYFSFLAEKRGAYVTAIDPNQGDGDNILNFELAKEALKSSVYFKKTDLENHSAWTGETYDVVLYYGVLYHVSAPFDELAYLYNVVEKGGMAII